MFVSVRSSPQIRIHLELCKTKYAFNKTSTILYKECACLFVCLFVCVVEDLLWVRLRRLKITLRALGAETRNASFLKIVFIGRADVVFVRYSTASNGVPSYSRFRFEGTGRTDFVFVRYSTTNNDLPRNDRFNCEDNVVRLIPISETMCTVFAQIFFVEISSGKRFITSFFFLMRLFYPLATLGIFSSQFITRLLYIILLCLTFP
jgi:hypothetical protein